MTLQEQRVVYTTADELLMFDVIERALANLGHAVVTFRSSNIVIDNVNVNKTLGKLRLDINKAGIYYGCC